MKEIDLNSLPYSQARELAATGVPVYVFVNPVEYHGPHLPLYNDYLLSRAAAEDLHPRLQKRHPEWPLVFGAPLHLGVDPVPGFGSAPTSYGHLKKAILKACDGLAELGVMRVIFMTFHGSPLHAMALQAGVEHLGRRGIKAVAPFNFILDEMLSYKPGHFAQALKPIADEAMREHVNRNLDTDIHAGFFETSLVLHYRPDVVDPTYRDLPPCPSVAPAPAFRILSRVAGALGLGRLSAELRFAAHGVGWLRLKPLLGYTGWPHLASAEAGRVFAEHAMRLYVAGVEAVFEDRAKSPEPAMKWVRTLSLGGRIQAH